MRINRIDGNRVFNVDDLMANTSMVQIKKSRRGPPHPGPPGTSRAEIHREKQKRAQADLEL